MNKEKNIKKAFLWNMIGSTCYSASSFLYLLVVTRICGEELAGFFSLSYATAQLLLQVGRYGMRTFQATDLQQKYRFSEYRISRVITCAAMMLFGLLYSSFSFTGESIAISIFVILMKMVDAVEDVYHGNFQQKYHVELMGKMLAARNIYSAVFFTLSLLAAKNLYFTCAATALTSLALCITMNSWFTRKYDLTEEKSACAASDRQAEKSKKRFEQFADETTGKSGQKSNNIFSEQFAEKPAEKLQQKSDNNFSEQFTEKTLTSEPIKSGACFSKSAQQKESGQFSIKHITELLRMCTPLFIGTFLSLLLYNIPKYAMAGVMSDEYQTYYSILFMPSFVISLMCEFVFKPTITTIAELWWDNRLGKFVTYVLRIIGLILAAAAVIVAAGHLLGRTLLELIYGVDLSPYKLSFVVLLIGGGISGEVYMIYNILIAIRKGNCMLPVYTITALLTILPARTMVRTYGIMGAALNYLLSCSILFVLFGTILILVILKKRKELKNQKVMQS